MATAYVSIGKAGAANGIEVFAGAVESETVTTSGTAASGSLSPSVPSVAKVVLGAAGYVSTTGTASATSGVYCAADTAEYIAILPGANVSIIDA